MVRYTPCCKLNSMALKLNVDFKNAVVYKFSCSGYTKKPFYFTDYSDFKIKISTHQNPIQITNFVFFFYK